MNQSGIPANSAPVIASSRPPAVPVLGDREQTISPRGFSDALDTAAMRGDFDKGLSLQVYLPFCTTRCISCDRVAEVATDSSVIDRYLNNLGSELALISDRIGRGRPLAQLHVGGGTPSLLNSSQLALLAALIDEHFSVGSDCETVFEITPDRTSLTQLELIRGLGFRNLRIELREIESSAPLGLGRSYSPELLHDMLSNAKQVNFDSITFDIVYGLPGQTVSAVRNGIRLITEMGPSRVLCRPFERDEQRFEHQRAIDSHTMPSVPEKMAMFAAIVDQLESSGFEWIGINSFVKPDDALSHAQSEGRLVRNRLGYSDKPTRIVLGVGLGAVSELPNLLSRNHTSLEAWHEALNNKLPPTCAGVIFTSAEAKQRRLVHRLSETLRAPVTEFEGAEQQGLLDQLQAEGLVTAESEWVQVTDSGRFRLLQLWDPDSGDLKIAKSA
jgi:oxygen-independent coproporphyrinogen-3 oxidase